MPISTTPAAITVAGLLRHSLLLLLLQVQVGTGRPLDNCAWRCLGSGGSCANMASK